MINEMVLETQATDICTIDLIAAATGFRYNERTGRWHDLNGYITTDANVGFAAYYARSTQFGDMLTEGMRDGWMEAEGEVMFAQAMVADANPHTYEDLHTAF